jgi:hypothetical protein
VIPEHAAVVLIGAGAGDERDLDRGEGQEPGSYQFSVLSCQLAN